MLKTVNKQVVLSAIMALTLLFGMCGCASGSSETPNESDLSYPVVIDQSDVGQTNNENTTTTTGTDSESSKDDATTSSDVSNADSPITTTITSGDKVIDNGTNTTKSSTTTTKKDKTTTTKKPTTSTTKKPETTKKPTTTTTTKKETTTTKDPYETIVLHKKTTYYGFEGIFTLYAASTKPEDFSLDDFGLGSEDDSIIWCPSEYYDIISGSTVRFVCNGEEVWPQDILGYVDEVGRGEVPVRVK